MEFCEKEDHREERGIHVGEDNGAAMRADEPPEFADEAQVRLTDLRREFLPIEHDARPVNRGERTHDLAVATFAGDDGENGSGTGVPPV